MGEDDLNAERERQAAFLSKHQAFYDSLIEMLTDCIEAGDISELALHLAYLTRIIEVGLNTQVLLRQEAEVIKNASYN